MPSSIFAILKVSFLSFSSPDILRYDFHFIEMHLYFAEFCRSKTKSNQIWTHAEDKILLEKDKRGMMLLEQERGPAAVRERLTFLES